MANEAEPVRLRRGLLELDLCPGVGGCAVAFRHRGRDVMRPSGKAFRRSGDPFFASCFPLVPFFNRIADARFAFQVRGYHLERHLLPEPHAIHDQGRQNPGVVGEASASRAELDLEHCFGGWDGRVELRWPESGLTLTIKAEPVFGHLVIYVPPGKDFFCVEPVSNVNDGFNLLDRGVQGTGVRVLEPGETLAGTIRLSIG